MSTKSNIVLLLAVCILSVPAFVSAQEDPIDEWLRNAVDESEKNSGTAITGRHIAPYVEAQRLWDIELNKVYKKLMSVLPDMEKQTLKTEQRKWLQYRDHKFGEIWKEQFSYYGEGNAAVQVTEYKKSNFIKERVLQLRDMLLNAQRPNQ